MKQFLVWLICLSLLFTLPATAGESEYASAQGLSTQSTQQEETTQTTAQPSPVLLEGQGSVVQTATGATAVDESAQTAVPQTETPVFYADTLTAYPGQTVTLAVGVNNNPGIVSAKLALSYDADVMEGVALSAGDFPEVSFGPVNANPLVINFMDSVHPSNTTNGVLATVTFKVKETAPAGEYGLTLSFDPADVFDYNLIPVAFETQQGCVTVKDHRPGDLNGDNNVDNKDLSLLLRYLNGWMVQINENAADVNGDGQINNVDFGLLQRYLNGWDVTLTYGNFVESAQDDIRVATYNIRAMLDASGDPAVMANHIRENGLNVVGLQEVDNNTGRGDCTLHQAKALAEELGWYYGYSKAINLYSGEYGTAVVSKYPITSYTTIELVSTGEEQRVMGHGVINIGGKAVNFLNVHLSYQSQLPNQLTQITEYVKNLDNYILVGDFNCSDFEALSKIGGHLVNCYSSTFVTNEDGAIDNIIVKGHTVGNGTMVEKVASDHNMLYADVTLFETPTAVNALRAGTYNIHYLSKTAGDTQAVADFIASKNLDVVGLQEVDKNVGREGPVQDQAKVLAEKLGWYYGYSKAITLGSGEYGNAIISKYPIVSYKTVSLESGAEEQRVMGHGVIQVGGQQVNVLNTHLSFYEMNQTQITQIKNYVASLDAYILTGDFSTANFVNLAQIDGKMINNTQTTFLTSVEDGAVDNIFVKGYGATNGVMAQSEYSDHHLLYTAINLFPSVNQVNGLRVGTYNIRHLADVGGDATIMAEFIRSQNLDVVGLQEVDNNVGRDGPAQNQVKAIAEALGWYWGFSKAIDLSGGEYGHGIISKYPIEAYATYALESGAEEARAMGHAVLNVAGRKVNFLNVHLSWQEMTGTQVGQVANHAKGYGKYIVVGDFNAEYDELTPIAGTMVNNATDRFVTNVEDGCIDNIIVNGMTVGTGTMVESSYSDHSMLYADVTF